MEAQQQQLKNLNETLSQRFVEAQRVSEAAYQQQLQQIDQDFKKQLKVH
jgi:hypothetical protein